MAALIRVTVFIRDTLDIAPDKCSGGHGFKPHLRLSSEKREGGEMFSLWVMVMIGPPW